MSTTTPGTPGQGFVIATPRDCADLNCFRPDWSITGTAKVLESELEGFAFKGIGWYVNDRGAMLILPVDQVVQQEDWKETVKWGKRQMFRVYVYNDHWPRDVFAVIGKAPVIYNTSKTGKKPPARAGAEKGEEVDA